MLNANVYRITLNGSGAKCQRHFFSCHRERGQRPSVAIPEYDCGLRPNSKNTAYSFQRFAAARVLKEDASSFQRAHPVRSRLLRRSREPRKKSLISHGAKRWKEDKIFFERSSQWQRIKSVIAREALADRSNPVVRLRAAPEIASSFTSFTPRNDKMGTGLFRSLRSLAMTLLFDTSLRSCQRQ